MQRRFALRRQLQKAHLLVRRGGDLLQEGGQVHAWRAGKAKVVEKAERFTDWPMVDDMTCRQLSSIARPPPQFPSNEWYLQTKVYQEYVSNFQKTIIGSQDFSVLISCRAGS